MRNWIDCTMFLTNLLKEKWLVFIHGALIFTTLIDLCLSPIVKSKGTAIPSFTSKYLLEKQGEKQQITQYDIDFVKAAAGSLYSGQFKSCDFRSFLLIIAI